MNDFQLCSKKVMYITETKYPNSDAMSVRMHMIAKALIEMGNTVDIYSRGQKNENSLNEALPFTSLCTQKQGKITKLIDYYIYFKKKIIKNIKEKKPDIVLVYYTPTSVLKKLIKLQKKYGFVLMHDCVEWYSKEQFYPSLYSKLAYCKREKWMRKLLPENAGIIAISRYLESYFLKCKNRCMYIPAICDTQAISFEKDTNEDKIEIVYAGAPGKKDYFREIIYALKMLNPQEKEKITLRVIGATPQRIAQDAQVSEKEVEELGEVLQFLPRMSHQEVLKYLAKADFTILIRPVHLRYAQAGFPTKVPESLATGTPVICNLTSDLGRYLQNGKNALIVESCRAESVCEALRKALKMSFAERQQMYDNARKTAEQFFDYRLYKQELNSFINN
ncbi:MAG: glycosyltransferase family 4 protein [Ruminococcaceae bacterium]|nr:glycosyltransferase family 4 protein [Oscillospiraceae bacterium]